MGVRKNSLSLKFWRIKIKMEIQNHRKMNDKTGLEKFRNWIININLSIVVIGSIYLATKLVLK